MTYNFYVPAFFVVNYLLVKLNRTYIVLEYMSKIVTVLAVVSLIFWFLCSIVHVLNFNTSVWIDWGQIKQVRSFHNVHFETQAVTLMGRNIIRNTGIFCEAPMYSFDLVISLFYNLLFNRKKSNITIFILLVTILTTLSTTGILMLLYAFLVMFVYKKQSQKILIVLKNLLMIIVIPVLVVVGIVFLTMKMQTGSYLTRMDDITGLIQYWQLHP
ncbi:hypothetical protein K1W63_12195, partial [Weissella cibaria]|nr:hypothetical protein [Weissella cibaria]